MEKNMLFSYLRNQFIDAFSQLEKIIEICPDDIWNNKKSGFVFWQQLMHAFAGMVG